MSGARMPDRDRRAVLWLTCAAVCWRWLVAVRAPMPSEEACRDLFLAERLVAGDFAELLHRWWEPLYGLLLAPGLALGAPSFAAAQVVACVLGGLAVVPVALAAERLRPGAGVPAAVVAALAPGSVLAAAAGGATGLYSLLGGLALWAFATGRNGAVVALGVLLVLARSDPAPLAAWWTMGAATVLAPLVLRGRRVSFRHACALALPVAGVWWVAGSPWTQPAWWPILAVLVGVAMATAHVRVRDVVLCLLAAADMYATWHGVEPPAAVAERIVPRYLQRRELREGEVVGSTLPRVQWGAGARPDVRRSLPARFVVIEQLARGPVVVRAEDATDPPTDAVAIKLPPDLQDLADEHGLVVLRRRP